MPIMTQDAPAADVFMCHSDSLNERYHSDCQFTHQLTS